MKKKVLALTVSMVISSGICFSYAEIPSYNSNTVESSQKILKSNKKKAIIKRLSKKGFDMQFANNPKIPRTNNEVIDMAKRLYSKEDKGIKEECGEGAYGNLYAALSNPEITEETIDKVGTLASASMPSQPLTYTSGHFKFYYTTNDSVATNNVTFADIEATATILNNAWNDYTTNFTEPLSYVSSNNEKLIDVYVYDLGNSLYGQTSSYWNYIELNSNQVVTNYYKRKTTPVHELFHRVQYSYGYVSGSPSMRWAVEGTAAWSQKYMASDVGDWMQRMNQGLAITDTDLIVDRSYNACHFWSFLGQRTTNGEYGGIEKNFIKQTWNNYSTNGNNMKNAVDSAIKSIMGSALTFDTLSASWLFSNYYKDITNAISRYDYEEDEWTRTAGSNNYGPLSHIVPTQTATIALNGEFSTSGSVASYGADYYVVNISNYVGKVEINSTAVTNTLGYAVVEIKNGICNTFSFNASGKNSLTYSKQFTPGSVDKIAVVVMGVPNGGSYTLNVKGLN